MSKSDVRYVVLIVEPIREKLIEYAWYDLESPMRNNLKSCTHFQHLYGVLSMFDKTPEDEVLPAQWNLAIQSLQETVKILDNDSNRNKLLYKEALNVESKYPSINKGLKASRQLTLFKWCNFNYLKSVDAVKAI